MTKNDKAILLGMCLGDGYLNKNGTLYIEHSINQKEYVEWKHKLLNKIINNGRQSSLFYRERVDKRTGKTYKHVSCHKGHKYFKLLRKWLYKPQKVFSRPILNRLTPQSIAIWHMDDGNLRVKRDPKTKKVTSLQVTLALHVDYDQAQVVRDYFKEVWGIEFSIYHLRGKYLLCANTKSGNKFLDLVRPHMIPSMLYKADVISKSAQPRKDSAGEEIV